MGWRWEIAQLPTSTSHKKAGGASRVMSSRAFGLEQVEGDPLLPAGRRLPIDLRQRIAIAVVTELVEIAAHIIVPDPRLTFKSRISGNSLPFPESAL
jgi:hypothetical protein